LRDIKNKLQDKAEIVEKTLDELIDNEDIVISDTLQSAMEYTLFSGGKRIRPILTLLVAEMMNGNITAAKKVGASIELIHTYSLIHDDLPSMDDDKYRRGKLTNHKVYSPGIAILAGDSLLTEAFDILSEIDLPAKKLIKIINIITSGSGANGMVGGQVLDLEAENKQLTLEELKTIHRAKTGGLFQASVLAGAYCAEPEAKEISALKEYADCLGLIFQITDDILDVTGDLEKLGKSAGKDKKLNKCTYPSLLGLERAKQEAEALANKAKNEIAIFASKAAPLKDIIDYVLIRQY
jgi:geranylgeranyl diphosphate synthase type II